jgi:hypothetical protein
MGLEDKFAQRATIKWELREKTPQFVLNFLFLYLSEFLFNTTENIRGSSAPFVKNHKWQLNGSNSSGIRSYSSRTLLYPVDGLALLSSTRGADKSLAWLSSRCIFFYDENISFDASLVIYINSNNIPPIMIINRIYETQNLRSL